MTNVKIEGPDNVKLPDVLGGDRLDSVRVKQAGKVEDVGNGNTRVEGFTQEGFDLQEVKRMVNQGAEIEGFEVWFELNNASTLDDPHPLAPTEDSEGNPITPETWAEYGVIGNSHAAAGPYSGKYYRSSSMFSSGEPLLASVWKDWLLGPNSWGIVITVEEYNVIQAAQVP